MKAWLKGVIIVLSIYIVRILFSFIYTLFSSNNESWLGMVLIPMFPIGQMFGPIIYNLGLESESLRIALAIITNIVGLIIIGAFIGWIIGKIKSKEVTKNN